ncbi:MAG: hypothetical protein OXM55_02170, partial [Bdellovibrionales bacterium]|nr:hypothetical protein [Bdellovibrionales bacterium]
MFFPLYQKFFLIKLRSKGFYFINLEKVQALETNKKQINFSTQININNFIKNIYLFFIFSIPLICLAESSSLPNPENTFEQQSKKTILTVRNTNTPTQANTNSTETVRRGRMPVRETGSIEPQYEQCKGKDIYKLNSEFQDTSDLGGTEATGPCMDCFIDAASNDDSINDIQQTLQTEVKEGTEAGKGYSIRTRTGVRTGKARTISPYSSFKDQLRTRVLGQVKTKI